MRRLAGRRAGVDNDFSLRLVTQMLLTIRTLSCPPPDNPQNIHAQFDAAGGRIGRSPPCKLILPDPNRHISREHAEIRSSDDAFSIKVVSKVNSVLVNDAVVGPGEAVDA